VIEKQVVVDYSDERNNKTYSGKVKSDCPTNDVNPAIFFANLEGDLLREDPTMFRAFADAKPAKKEA
jgi:hypothetical protein